MRRTLVIASIVSAAVHASAQTPVEYEVVSIKRNTSIDAGGGLRTLPDGTLVMVNQPLRSILSGAAPRPVREIVGAPDWVMTERYDVTAKPPAGSTREQREEMRRTLFRQRMKLVAHVEDQERDTFALVLARSDGRLGPKMKRSTLDCSPRPPGAPPAPQPADGADFSMVCGMRMSSTSIVSGAISMGQLVQSLGGLAGGLVNDRTGLEGFFTLELTYSQPGLTGANEAAPPPDAPEFFTALQEQLGLRLVREKTMVPVLVIDSIERPSDN
jgi:uncharacterized protein (TIGR03435 family)